MKAVHGREEEGELKVEAAAEADSKLQVRLSLFF